MDLYVYKDKNNAWLFPNGNRNSTILNCNKNIFPQRVIGIVNCMFSIQLELAFIDIYQNIEINHIDSITLVCITIITTEIQLDFCINEKKALINYINIKTDKRGSSNIMQNNLIS